MRRRTAAVFSRFQPDQIAGSPLLAQKGGKRRVRALARGAVGGGQIDVLQHPFCQKNIPLRSQNACDSELRPRPVARRAGTGDHPQPRQRRYRALAGVLRGFRHSVRVCKRWPPGRHRRPGTVFGRQ